jgi:hypothetical protein
MGPEVEPLEEEAVTAEAREVTGDSGMGGAEDACDLA